MVRTALLAVTCMLATATAGPRSKTSTLVLTSTSIAGNGADLVKKVQRASTSAKPAVFHECEGAWTIHYAVALTVAVPSAELTLKITDLSSGAEPEPVATRRKFVYSEAVVARGVLRLERDDVPSPNAKLLLAIESDGVAIAKQTFYIQGRAQAAASSTVEFTAEEAAGTGDEVATEDVRSKRPR